MTIQNQEISTHVCSNGLKLVFEHMSGVESAALRWMIPAGAVFEDIHNLGCSSVCAEMLMRGAGELDSQAQANAFDRVGALRDVSNSIRYMQVSLSAMGSKLPEAMSLVADIVRKPMFAQESFAPACELAMQSVASLADDPHRRTALAARKRHLPSPFNRDTHGTIEGIQSLTRDQLVEWWASHALPTGSILSIAGSFDQEQAIASIESCIQDWSGETVMPEPSDVPERGYSHIEDDSNQVQIMVVHDGPHQGHPDLMLEKAAISVLSGGMSGRLFTEVREKRGLCYSVSASHRSDKDRGVVSNYVGTTPERAQESLDVLLAETHRIGEGNVTQEELDRAMTGLKSRLIFSGESTGARAGAIAADMINLGRARSLDEILKEVDAITLDDLNAYLQRRNIGKMTIQTLGPSALNPPAK